MPSGAPTDAEYILLAANALLPNARVFTVSGLLVATDGGAGNDYDVGLDEADLTLLTLPTLAGNISSTYIAKSLLTTNGDIIYRASGAPARLGIGSTGDVLTVAGGLPSWAAPAGGGGVPPGPPFRAGQYYGPQTFNSTFTAFTLTANNLVLIPMFIPNTVTFDRALVDQAASGAVNFRVGLYGPLTGAASGTALAHDSGTIASSGAGQTTATISWTMTAGWYLLAMLSDTSKSMNALNSAGFIASIGLGTTGAQYFSGYHVSQSFGALPSTVPAGLTTDQNNWPVGLLRAS